MSLRLSRVVVSLALAPWLGFASTMPPEHVHEADSDHPHAIVHRHGEAHAVDAGGGGAGSARFDHNEERVVWLSNATLACTIYRVDVLWADAGRPLETLRDAASWIATASYDAAPAHGPPRASLSLRAPPPAFRVI